MHFKGALYAKKSFFFCFSKEPKPNKTDQSYGSFRVKVDNVNYVTDGAALDFIFILNYLSKSFFFLAVVYSFIKFFLFESIQ